MTRRMVDVAVVGGELCGLAAAALLALSGKRVVLIDDGDSLVRPLGDRLCPLAPSLWRLPPSGAAAGLFDALALKADARRLFGDVVGLGVVDDDDLRCVIPVGEEARARELTRCFGADRAARLAAALAEFDGARRNPLLAELATLHEDGWLLQARRARKRVQALGAIGDLDADDDALTPLWGDGTALAPVLAQLRGFVQKRAGARERGLAGVLAATQLCAGVPTGIPLGARPALRELLIGFVQHHGGEMIVDRVESASVDGRRITGLRTEKKKEDLVPSVVIDATSARDLVDRLPASRAREKLLAQQGRIVATGAVTAVRWLLPVRVLPRGIAPMLLVLGQDGPPVLAALLPGAPAVDAGKGAHLDEQLLCVVAAAATDDATRIEDVLRRLMPFAREHAHAADIVDARAFHGSFDVKESEHPLSGRRPRTAFTNLVRAGRDLAPAFGIDGELVSARSVVAVVEQALPRAAAT